MEREVAAAVPESVDIEFHGTLYTITTQVHGEDVLVVEIEDKETFDRWRGEFAAKYVEDITSKTSNFKKFAVFVRMLQSAVLQQSDSVFVDLLTYQDLEMLKSKKSNGSAAAARPLPASNKRYLILTYASEFDRVHYPLPLLAEEQPDPLRLKAVIQQLRQQLQEVQAAQQLAQQASRQQLPGRQRAGSSSQTGSGDAADALLLSSRVEVLAAQLERERADHKRELRRKARELQELQEELCRSRDVARDLRLRVKSLEQELADTAASAAAAAAATGAAPRRRAGTGTASGVAAAGAAYRRGAGGIDSSRWSHGSSSYLSGSGKYPVSKYPARTGGRGNANNAPSIGYNSSRGSSPASSRAQSPGYSRPWAQGSPRPPRPSSAPPKQRFDPTEYVRQKRAREQQLATQRSSAGSRGSSPARSSSSRGPGGSGASTPRGLMLPVAAARGSSSSNAGGGVSRQSSLERRSSDSSLRAAAARDGDRGEHGYLRPTLSSGRSGGGGGSGGSIRAVRGIDAAGLPAGVVRSSSRRERLGAAYGVADVRSSSRGSSRGSQGSGLGANQNRPASRDGQGAASPGRALQGVRDKLTAFMAKQQQDPQQQQQKQPGVSATTKSPLLPSPGAAAAAGDTLAAVAAAAGGAAPAAAAAAAGLASGGSRVFEDASSEIADIDQRLHALQDFLKKAKCSVAAS